MDTNILAKIFKTLSELVNSAEKSILDFFSAIVPYLVPVIPAYLTYFHTRDVMAFPDGVAWTAAVVVEVLGITAVSTSIRFYRWNLRYTTVANKAPFALAIGTYVFYLVIVLAVNVILEIVTGARSGWVIFSIGLFSLLSVPSGVLISIRSQFAEMLDEKQERAQIARTERTQTGRTERTERAQPERTQPAQPGLRTYALNTDGISLEKRARSLTSRNDSEQFTGARARTETKICACGCGISFEGRADKMYLNNAHRMRHQRAQTR
jgi:hypothetical protein